ncbi:MAG TPA: AMP-binding protein [Rhodocyclaceae bacterium]|nr:AMP-binding protein [Rhodocyclaceae bacterium]
MNDLPLDWPLVSAHGLDDVLAWDTTRPRRVRDLLADATALAARLPAGGHLLNICENRWHFAVGFCAGLLHGKISLQPTSQSTETLQRLRLAYPDMAVLTDGDPIEYTRQGLACLPYPQDLAPTPADISVMPSVPAAQLAAILFTSGSTGQPQAHGKTWGKLVANGRAAAKVLGLDKVSATIVATVPIQHSYGFESTLLIALHGGATFWTGKPFYPQDIVTALAAVPSPRLLVTTPFHLSTLLAANLPLPPLTAILSATAPLPNALATRAEASSNAPVLEIYGSTESGQLAWRRTLKDAVWQLLPDVELHQNGEQTTARGAHVEGEVILSDLIELLPDRRFILQGRKADLINIAGKRTSLAYLNRQITALPGVQDAAFFLPDTVDEADVMHVTRLVAFVVAPDKTVAELLIALREKVDAVFMPRPMLLVDALPRNSTGKLPRSELAALYAAKTARK